MSCFYRPFFDTVLSLSPLHVRHFRGLTGVDSLASGLPRLSLPYCSCSSVLRVLSIPSLRNDRFFESGTFLLPPGALFSPSVPPSRFLGVFRPKFPLASLHASRAAFLFHDPIIGCRGTGASVFLQSDALTTLSDPHLSPAPISTRRDWAWLVSSSDWRFALGSFRTLWRTRSFPAPWIGSSPRLFSAGLTQDI